MWASTWTPPSKRFSHLVKQRTYTSWPANSKTSYRRSSHPDSVSCGVPRSKSDGYLWTAIEKLAAVPQIGEAAAAAAALQASTAKPAAEMEKPKAQRKAKRGAQAAHGAPEGRSRRAPGGAHGEAGAGDVSQVIVPIENPPTPTVKCRPVWRRNATFLHPALLRRRSSRGRRAWPRGVALERRRMPKWILVKL
jgi:hypothetical protein